MHNRLKSYLARGKNTVVASVSLSVYGKQKRTTAKFIGSATLSARVTYALVGALVNSLSHEILRHKNGLPHARDRSGASEEMAKSSYTFRCEIAFHVNII